MKSSLPSPGWSRTTITWALMALLALGCPTAGPLRASDHGDMAILTQLKRADGNISDLFAFVRQNRLVLILCINTAIPVSASHYVFSSDLTLRFHIDNHTPVAFDSLSDMQTYGGTVMTPGKVSEDIVLETTFDDHGQPRVKATGLKGGQQNMRVFAGLRDDPFIRGPRQGRNVAAVVIDLPLESVIERQSTLLVWGTSKIPEIHGFICDHVGRSLRSMMPKNDPFNTMRPRDDYLLMGRVPDVILYDTSRPAHFPNGRELSDDVVDLVGDPRVLVSDAPFPSQNDRPHLEEFPYLALPHPPR